MGRCAPAAVYIAVPLGLRPHYTLKPAAQGVRTPEASSLARASSRGPPGPRFAATPCTLLSSSVAETLLSTGLRGVAAVWRVRSDVKAKMNVISAFVLISTITLSSAYLQPAHKYAGSSSRMLRLQPPSLLLRQSRLQASTAHPLGEADNGLLQPTLNLPNRLTLARGS